MTQTDETFTAFQDGRRVARGPLADVALALGRILAARPDASMLVFRDRTGAVIDLDLRGSAADILSRLAQSHPDLMPPDAPEQDAAARGRGRPRLGVVPREVTLLPRHWEWLAAQPGGASAALRRLIDDARRSRAAADQARLARDAAYRAMSAAAGDLPGFEDAARALFAGDRQAFAQRIAAWPEDLRLYFLGLAPEQEG